MMPYVFDEEPKWVLHRLDQRRFAFAYDNLHFIVQRWGEHELQGVDASKAYRRKEDVTKKLFQLWRDAEEGRGKWWDSEADPIYVVACFDGDPLDGAPFVGEISAVLWAQLVSRLLNKKEVDRMIKT